MDNSSQANPSLLPQSQTPPGVSTQGGNAPAGAVAVPSTSLNGSPRNQAFSSAGTNGPSQLLRAQDATPVYSSPSPIPGTLQSNSSASDLPALRPSFGVSLDNLLKRDGSAIPLVIYQCIQAIDLFGLEVEGIYRLSGSSTHVGRLKAIFDNGECFTGTYRFDTELITARP